MENIYVARQPIYDANNSLFGYELLYRTGEVDIADIENGKLASSEVIMHSFVNIGVDDLVGSAFAFINITEEFLHDESMTPMFENQTVLEILETIEPSEKNVAGIKRLKEKGFLIALDDFKFSEKYLPFLELADYVKIDVIQQGMNEIPAQIEKLKQFNVKFIAEKVETQEMYELCRKLPFDYFQGFFFCKPQVVKTKNIPANKLVVLTIMQKLENPEFDLKDVEQTLAHDATLTYKLLRYVNSAAFAQRREIESIREALMLVGANTIKKWVYLILMTQLTEGKPEALLDTALTRAKMCELIADNTDLNSEQLFTIGLLSLLDAMMDMEMVDLLDQLTLSTPVKLALLDYEGKIGEVLLNVILYEQGQWSELAKLGVDVKEYFSSYMDAIKWCNSTIIHLQET